MDVFTDRDSKNFLTKEWLVKIDNANSRPYLFKFYHSNEELRCCILITDTRNVWFEALDSKQLSRRWRHLNHDSQSFEDQDKENIWRSETLRKLSSIHTLKSVQESFFSIEDSRDADLAIELQPLDCKWRWEGYTLGPKTSAEILSKHLILPLLSVTHLSFTSADPVSELTTQDLEQAVDNVARTGRRSQDVHVRQTLSRPRVATTIQRMTAMFNFAEPIPPIVSVLEEAEDVDMAGPSINLHAFSSNTRVRHPSPTNAPRSPTRIQNSPPPSSVRKWEADRLNLASEASGVPDSEASREPVTRSVVDKAAVDDSATEPESDGDGLAPSVGASQPVKGNSQPSGRAPSARPGPSSRASGSRAASAAAHASSSDSTPPRPASKRAKLNIVPEDSSGDSGDGRKKATTTGKSGGGRGVGVRQPIKRGGRRF